MAKILLVEDDQSLREIYSIRLTAEGYEIVTAGDGEEALAVAVKERPDLVLSDVMMPKISGFDMLDILRSTPETKDIRVIMMTALSSDDQRQRGENLGADRYLVKSQVGIEDVVNTVHEVMGDLTAPEQTDATSVDTVSATPSTVPQVADIASTTAPQVQVAPQPVPPVPPSSATPPVQPVPPATAAQPIPQASVQQPPVASAPTTPSAPLVQ